MTVLLYDFSFKNENFATFTFVVKDYLRYLRTFSQVLATLIKYYNLVFCIFKCILILFMCNIIQSLTSMSLAASVNYHFFG